MSTRTDIQDFGPRTMRPDFADDNQAKCASCLGRFPEHYIRHRGDEGFEGYLCADCANEVIYDK